MTDLFEPDATTTTSLDMRRLQREQRRRARRRNLLIMSAIALVVFAIGGSLTYNFLQGFERGEDALTDYPGAGQGVVQVVVEQGDTGADIAQTLFEAGVIATPEAFIMEARNNAQAASITPGFYFLQREMKAEYALRALLDPSNRNELRITISEGRRLDHYYQAIANVTGHTPEEVQEIAEADPEALGLPEQADGNLEGWLFPSTYTFNPNVEPADMLSEMIRTTITVLDRNNVDLENRQRVLTVASIIEREARLDEDRPMVAQVIYNRLEIDMQLEMDSTVKYLSPSPGVFTSDEERAIDSPYNTYRNTGLPPGPIAAPGEAAIRAAMEPADTDALFFVTVNLETGETLYADTYDEHLRNVDVLQQWIRDNQSDDED